jgi:hypothetical protein
VAFVIQRGLCHTTCTVPESKACFRHSLENESELSLYSLIWKIGSRSEINFYESCRSEIRKSSSITLELFLLMLQMLEHLKIQIFNYFFLRAANGHIVVKTRSRVDLKYVIALWLLFDAPFDHEIHSAQTKTHVAG